MEELLKKINGNLIEIKTKLDKDTFHISGGRNNIGQQNNYTLENKFNSLYYMSKLVYLSPLPMTNFR